MSRFIGLPPRILTDFRLKKSDFRVLMFLEESSGKKGYCWPAYSKISKKCRIDRSTAIRSVQHLVKCGYLVKSKRTIGDTDEQTSNYYFIKFDPE